MKREGRESPLAGRIIQQEEWIFGGAADLHKLKGDEHGTEEEDHHPRGNPAGLAEVSGDRGLIKRLLDEKNPPGQLLGAKWAVYEPVLERFSILSGIE